MADKINVPIVTSYDDKAAKKAITDAEKIDDLKPEIEIEITADDEASEVIEEVTEDVQALDKLSPDVTVTADDKASADIKSVKEEAEALDKADAEIVLTAKIDAAKADLASLQAELKTTGERAEDTSRQLDRIGGDGGGGLQTRGNAIADLTGPLGEASGAASDFAGVFDGLGDIAADTASKLGASAGATAAISGVVGGLGIVVAAGAAAWSLYQGSQKKAREEMEKAVTAQKDLTAAIIEGNEAAAVKAFEDLYGDVIDDGLKAGLTIKQVTDYINGQDAPARQLHDRIATLTNDYNRESAERARAQAAGETYNSTTETELRNAKEQLASLEAGRAKRVEVNGEIGTSVDRAEELATALGVNKEKTDEVTDATTAYADSQRTGQRATDDSTDATEDATRGVYSYEQSLQDLNDAIDDRIAKTTELVGGDIAVRNAQRDAKTAVEELTTATNDNSLSQEELATQTDAAALELIGAAQAAADYEEDLAAAEGRTLTAKEQQQLLKEKLGELASTLAPGSPLRMMLDGYISDLEGIPPVINTEVRVTRTGDLLTPINGRRAAGGTGPGDFLVGEDGPEIVRLPNGAQVIPAATSFAMMHNGNGNVAPMTVNINMPKGSRGVDVLRQVTNQARRSGRRYGTPVVHYARRPA